MTTTRVVDVGEVQIAITEAGVGGRPLLLVHGYTGAGSDFEDFVEPLAERGWHVVAPDLRGHGGSSKPADEAAYDYELFVADLLALADSLGWERFVLLGHSMGGMIAQILVLTAPDRVEALVLMDTGHGSLAVDPSLIELAVTSAREQGMEFVADFMAEAGDGPLTSDAYLRKVAEDPSYKVRGDTQPAQLGGADVRGHDGADQHERGPPRRPARRSRCRRSSSSGRRTRRSSARAGAWSTPSPAPRLAVVPGGGHSPQFEAPEAWWAALSAFLDQVAAARTGSGRG